jgi:outer membrane receptor for ferrienterochelin and colicins
MFKYLSLFLLLPGIYSSQEKLSLKGKILDEKNQPVPFAAIALLNTLHGTTSDSAGNFQLGNIPSGNYTFVVSSTEFLKYEEKLILQRNKDLYINLKTHHLLLNEVVVTGTLKETSKDESPINIDIITPKLFQKTSTPNLFEATSLVNGVKPQINCNVCNTGDIHINGLEGPYTLILIDGMPIVSGLSSVYGLMGIPASMIERLEIAKGPAGALYGSEAMGGTINLITKNASFAPKFYLDYYGTSWLENNLDLSVKLKPTKRTDWLIGTNTYYYDHISDINRDNFTDVTLQKRFSLFNKINFNRENGKEFSLGGRYVYEDRWGGQTNWRKEFRGGDSVYGESIFANRAEFIGKYEWPTLEKIFTQFSYNLHDQDSWYGTTPFMAFQSTAFTQTYWNKRLGNHDLTLGATYKHLWFDDNTVITQSNSGNYNQPEKSHTAGLFVQDEIELDSLSRHKLLLGFRGDYNSIYKFIPSPRIAYKWSPHYRLITRVNFGTGFRIVNVFTEDHAALTGARTVEFKDRIRPEQSYNGSLNIAYKMHAGASSLIIWDATAFYYHFTNKIFANYDEDPQKVIYDNLDGFAFSRGGSLSASLASNGNFKFTLGVTYADVQNIIKDSLGAYERSRQLQSPEWSGNIIIGYHLSKYRTSIDMTGNWYGPQRLPILPNDFRPEYSPWFCLLNIQITKKFRKQIEVYAGLKNLLNFVPEHPIMRAHDPFNRQASNSETNPNGYTFDPSYNYAPVQGIRGYVGLRWSI